MRPEDHDMMNNYTMYSDPQAYANPTMTQALNVEGVSSAPRYRALEVQGPKRFGLCCRAVLRTAGLCILGASLLIALAFFMTSFFAFDDPNGGSAAYTMFFMIWGAGIMIALGGFAAGRCLIRFAESPEDSNAVPVYTLTEMV